MGNQQPITRFSNSCKRLFYHWSHLILRMYSPQLTFKDHLDRYLRVHLNWHLKIYTQTILERLVPSMLEGLVQTWRGNQSKSLCFIQVLVFEEIYTNIFVRGDNTKLTKDTRYNIFCEVSLLCAPWSNHTPIICSIRPLVKSLTLWPRSNYLLSTH